MKKIIRFFLTIVLIFLIGVCAVLVINANKPKEKEYISIDNIYINIKLKVDMEMMNDLSSSYIKEYYDIDTNLFEEYVFKKSSINLSSDMIFIGKLKDKKDISTVKLKLNDIRDSLISANKNLNETEYNKLKSSKIIVKGDYIYLIVNKNFDKINSIINELI